MSEEAYLPGVARADVEASIGPANAFPMQRMRKRFGLGHLPSLVACPGRCHNGGFDLGRELYDNVAKRRLTAAKGRLKCRGYQELGRHRRQACDYTFEYDARMEYGAGGLDL